MTEVIVMLAGVLVTMLSCGGRVEMLGVKYLAIAWICCVDCEKIQCFYTFYQCRHVNCVVN